MRYVPISMLEDGMALGQDIYDGSGRMLLAKHLLLNQEYINGLASQGFPGAYIDDDFSQGLEINEIVRPEIKREALKMVNSLFVGPENAMASEGNLNDLVMKVVNSVLDNGDVMCNMIDLKNYDDYTYFHSVNVSVLATMLGANLDMKPDELQCLGVAAMLHDVGKRFIDKDILLAERRLTLEETNEMKRHCQLGVEFLKKRYNFSAYVYAGILEHHEWFSGEGYPLGKSGKEIPFNARIIKLVDVYDALTSNRPYRDAESPSEAVEYLMAMNGREFDPIVLDAFLRKIAVYPVGCQIELSDGRQAMVIENYKEFILRPVVKLLGSGEIIDLKSDPTARSITITRMIMK